MRTELMQMERMALDERLGAEAGEIARKQKDIRRRMRREMNYGIRENRNPDIQTQENNDLRR